MARGDEAVALREAFLGGGARHADVRQTRFAKCFAIGHAAPGNAGMGALPVDHLQRVHPGDEIRVEGAKALHRLRLDADVGVDEPKRR